MKRGRKPILPLPVTPLVAELVRDQLNNDVLAFASNTHPEEPKPYTARMHAILAACDVLQRLASSHEQDEPDAADTLADARAGIAAEEET